MATTEVFDRIGPDRYIPVQGAPGSVPLIRAGDGLLAGFPLPKTDTAGLWFISSIPALGTPVTTGITLRMALVDDPNNTGAGLVVRLGVTCKLLASGTDNFTTTGAATEQEVSVTMDATTGEYVLGTLAITTANADTVAASSVYAVRIRRLGSAATDTHQGRVLLMFTEIRDT